MGIFNKKIAECKTQKQWAKEALLKGEVLDQKNMLYDFGIGNHTGVIAQVRKDFDKEGKGYYYVQTRMVQLRAKRSGRLVRVARYYIPECLNDKQKRAMNL